MSPLVQELGDRESGRHQYIVTLLHLFWTILASRDQPTAIRFLVEVFVFTH